MRERRPERSGQGIAKRAAAACRELRDIFVLAVDTLWANRLRSFLTILGIVIGIAAVVLVGAAIEALRTIAVATTTQTFGANTFILARVASSGTLSRRELADKLRKNPEILLPEARRLERMVHASTRLAATLQEIADVKSGNRVFRAASITGGDGALELIRDIRIAQGRFFRQEENMRAQRLVVIGQDIVDEIFPSVDPLGRQVKIQGIFFTVIGVQERQGSSFGSSLDRSVWMPLLAFQRIWGTQRSLTVFAQPRETHDFEAAQEETRVALRLIRGLGPREEDTFDLLIPEAGRGFVGRLTDAISQAIIPISSIALLVAGVVVMNMMLVSVTERTREIGIRKSLGATRRNILIQVLIESTLLCSLGGGLGLLLSYVGTFALSGAFGTGVGLPLSYLFLALGISALIGSAAGTYPAYLAARLDPVEALRSE